jgi:hypothetical protein
MVWSKSNARWAGPDDWWLRLTQNFYEQVDHQAVDWKSTTEDDARTLARLLMEDEAREQTSALHAASGWEKRRFNPAFQRLLRLIPDERAGDERQPDYPSSDVTLFPEDHAALRRFIAEAHASAYRQRGLMRLAAHHALERGKSAAASAGVGNAAQTV